MEELGLILFVSRNKDNFGLPDFKQRKYQFLTNKAPDDPKNMDKFQDFVSKGVNGELSRYYYSVNKRDSRKIQKDIIHYLIDNNVNISKLDSLASRIAAKPENRSENKWLFDFDIGLIAEHGTPKLDHFIEDIFEMSGDRDILESISDTITGYHIIVKHGFDTRILLEKYPNIELKRDDMRLISYMENTK